MKNKLLFLVSFMLLTIFLYGNVEARTCNYKHDGKDLSLTFTKQDGTETFEITECKYAGVNCDTPGSTDFVKIYNFVDGSLIPNDEACYLTLNTCVLTVRRLPTALLQFIDNVFSGEDRTQKYLGIFGSSLDPVTIDEVEANEFDVSDLGFWEASFWSTRAVECSPAVSTDNLSINQYVHYCERFVELLSEVRNAYIEYQDCGNPSSANNNDKKMAISKCRVDALSEVNRTSNNLKTTCNNIMQNASFSASDGCVQSCINAIPAVEALKMKYIGVERLNPNCSISGRLIIWIGNVVRWVKYILPVVVIILGILDFLRAIATNNDDAMKKAQGRFIKRLIAAALVFVIPFILEFILDKMGFSYNGCGIIDL